MAIVVTLLMARRLQLGHVQVSRNPAGAKKLWLVKRQRPVEDRQLASLHRILDAVQVSHTEYYAVPLQDINANVPQHTVVVVMPDIDEGAVEGLLTIWRAFTP